MHWRRCLEQIQERRGAIEIAIDRPYERAEEGSHLVWRVRVLAIDDAEIVVEAPTAVGRMMAIEVGVELIAVLTVGQNRWMFRTKNLGVTQSGGPRQMGCLRLELPTSVQRCQRRYHYRVRAATLMLPTVQIWPLLDPRSVVLAERASELQFERDLTPGANDGGAAATHDGRNVSIMPDVGPEFTAIMQNVGGGGIGICIPPDHNQSVARHRLFWLRIPLPPDLSTPICASAKLVHTHIQSDHHIYAGLAFDFSFNPSHQKFVAEQISRYIATQQRAQLEETESGGERKIA